MKPARQLADFLRLGVRLLVVGGGIVAAACLAAVTAAMIFEVFCRYLLSSPTDWALEVSTYLLAAIAMLGSAYTLRRHGHIGMELFYQQLPFRLRRLAYRISMSLVLVFSVVLVWFGIKETQIAILFGEVSLTSLAIPVAYPLSLIPIGGALLMIQAIELLISPPALNSPGAESETL